MIIDYKRRLVFLANTKVASSALESKLEALPEVGVIGRHMRLKHLNFSNFVQIRKGLGIADFETVAVIRNPLSKLQSWYRFRSRKRVIGLPVYSGDKSFREWVTSLSKSDSRLYDDRNFILDSTGSCVDHVFKFEILERFIEFLREYYGPDFVLPHTNRSPNRKIDFQELSEVEARISDVVAWYEGFRGSGRGSVG